MTRPPTWIADLPAAVRAAAERADHPLALAVARWSGVAARLGLGKVERIAGATLLAQEIDESIHLAIVEVRVGGACTRRDLVEFIRGVAGNSDALTAVASLERRGVIRTSEASDGVWAGTAIALARSVRDICLGVRSPSPAHDGAVQLTPRLAAQIDDILIACRGNAATEVHAIIRGRDGAGRDGLVAELLGRLDASVCRRTPLDLRTPGDGLEPALSGGAALWDARGYETSPEDLVRATAFLGRSPTLCISVLDATQDAANVQGRTAFVVHADPVDMDERSEAWRRALRPRVPDRLLEALVSAMSSQTRAGAGLAHRVARATRPGDADSTDAWQQALRRRLEDAAQPSQTHGVTVERPTISLDRVVISDKARRTFENVRLMARHAAALARPERAGVKLLLCGPPGTGKTLAARALASDLRRPLYRVDLATVVSKWVGETEKNLRRALDAAETVGAVLLFDEGDALFGRRADVERGADRYANLEVSFLLQAMEAFDGVAIVTTNLRDNIDRAFQRRFDFCVDFHRPEPRLRYALWRQELGAESAEVSDVLLQEIAEEIEISGGHIAVIARIARTLAIEGSRAIHDADVIAGLCTELRKIGSNVAAKRWEGRTGVA